MSCEIDDCNVCENGWTCIECGDTFLHRDDNAVHDEAAMCDECAHAAVDSLRTEIAVIRAAERDAVEFAFWSGVRARSLVIARYQYACEASEAHYAICTGREIYEDDMLPFWRAVRELQLLGEVGGEP